MKQPLNTTRLLVEIVATIAVVETAIMLIVPMLPLEANGWLGSALDAAILSLVAAPIILWRLHAASARAQAASDKWSRTGTAGMWGVTLGVLFVGLVLSAIAASMANREVERRAQEQFARLSERLTAEAARRVNQVRFGLAGARGAYSAGGTLNRHQFAAYVSTRNLKTEFPGAIGFGFIERVMRKDLAAFETRERADGAPDFRVWTLGSAGGSAAEHDDLWVIKHCFPEERNKSAWGLDVGSEPRRREAAVRAATSGEPAITGNVALVQDGERRTGFLYYVPVYHGGVIPPNEDERLANLIGLAYAPIILEEGLAGATESVDGMLDFEIFDGLVADKASQLYDADGHLSNATGNITSDHFRGRMFESRTPMLVGGRTWTFITSTTPKFESTVDRTAPMLLGAGGAVLSVLVAGFCISLLSSRTRAIALAHGMTSELAHAKADAEAALREVEAFRATLDRHSIISITDRSGKIIDVNEPFCVISGYTREELLGKDHRILNSGQHPKQFWVDAWRELAAGRPWRGEVCNRAKNGALYWVDSIIAPFHGPDGKVQRYVSIRTDITDRKHTEQALEEARAAAESASKAKSAFLANMSHEIRTPLTAILGFADLLHENEGQSGTVDRSQTVETIRHAGQHLLSVINDILDLSKIEADKMIVEKIETPLASILREVESLWRPRATGKGLEIRSHLDSPIPDVIMCDPTRLRQILMNLVGNAIKFTEVGSVTIKACVERERDASWLLLDIVDTGPGMTPEQAANLFQSFSQADVSVTRKHGGTGLGLTICRRLATLMGGGVTLAHTQPGQGSTFRVELPLEPAVGAKLVDSLRAETATSRPKIESTSLTLNGRILLAEDGVDNQRLISFHLRKAGATVDIAGDGRAALEMIEKAEADNNEYDLLLTDMQMPEMDGYTLARTLRERGNVIAIVALTAHAMAEDRKRCTDAGCDDYATKPIDKGALLSTCAKWIRQPSVAQVEQKAA